MGGPPDGERVCRFVEDLKAWSEICDHLVIWNYSANFRYSMLFYPNFQAMLANARLFADNHVVGVYEEGTYYSDTGDFPELRAYIMAKYLWDPYMSEEEYWGHIDDFLEGVYGPGWEYIRSYIDYTQEITRDKCCNIGAKYAELYPLPEAELIHPLDTYPAQLTAEMIRTYEAEDWTAYWHWYGTIPEKNPYLAHADECFAEALALAETDEQRAIIEKTFLHVDFYRSWYMLQRINTGAGGKLASQNVSDMMNAYFRDHPDEFTAEEQGNYRFKINILARNQVLSELAEFNKGLYERFKQFGIIRICESRGNFNFSADPETYLDFTKSADAWW